jgi:hypothetical protein
MTGNQSDWAYLTDEFGRYWYHLRDGTRFDAGTDPGQKPPQRALYAIPTHDIVSHPHWISSQDEEIISEVVAVENEKLGVKADSGPGRISDWKPVEINGTRTLVQSVAIPWHFEGLVDGQTEFVDFVPQYSLYAPPENAVVIWRENDGWVAGYSRENHWSHVQPLGKIHAGAVAGEIQLTLLELSAKDIIGKSERIIVWESDEPELLETLSESFDVPVAFRPRPAPNPAVSAGWKLEPHEITEKKLAQARRRRAIWMGILSCFLTLLLVAAVFFHIRWLEAENARLEQKIASNLETADRIELAQEQWAALGPAVDPKRNPVELFHRVSTLLPDKGFRLTGFRHDGHRTLILEGEGATMANSLQIKGAIEKAEELSSYDWQIGPPKTKNDLIEFSATGVLESPETEPES